MSYYFHIKLQTMNVNEIMMILYVWIMFSRNLFIRCLPIRYQENSYFPSFWREENFFHYFFHFTFYSSAEWGMLLCEWMRISIHFYLFMMIAYGRWKEEERKYVNLERNFIYFRGKLSSFEIKMLILFWWLYVNKVRFCFSFIYFYVDFNINFQ